MQEFLLWYAAAVAWLWTTAVGQQLTAQAPVQTAKISSNIGGGLITPPRLGYEKSAVQWDISQLINKRAQHTEFEPIKLVANDCMDTLKSLLFHPERNSSKSQYWDSTGKPAVGNSDGTLLWLGNYEMCQALPRGHYCLADFSVDATPVFPYPVTNQSSTQVRWGICAVDICNSSVIADHIIEILRGTLNLEGPLSLSAVEVNCVKKLQISYGFKSTIAVFSCLFALVILGTAVDLAHKYKVSHHPKLVYRIDGTGSHLVCSDGSLDEASPLLQGGGPRPSGSIQSSAPDEMVRPPDGSILRGALKQNPGRIVRLLQCFSLVSNLQEVFRIDVIPPTIKCLHSVRVLSSMWVVLGNSMLALYTTGLVDNLAVLKDYTKRFSWQVIPSTFLAGDTFFFLSGLLVAYVTLQLMEKKNGHLSLVRFYSRRYIRLTPLLAGVLFLWWYVIPHLGSGPVWYKMQSDSSCLSNWWKNFLYVQNFYPVHFNDICMTWTWYLALDAQFNLFSPILLHILYRSCKKGIVAATIMIFMSLATTASLIGYFNINVNMSANIIANNIVASDNYMSIVFDKPYVRVPPYIIGMITGYLLQRNSQNPRLTQRVKLKVIAVWIAAVAVCFCLVYGLYPTSHGYPLGLPGSVLYGSLCHTCWALALAWIVTASHRECGGVIGALLSWHGWVPLSRVTFAVYLVHPLVINIYNYSCKAPIHISDYYIGLYYCGLLLSCYAAGLFLTLVVEQPLISMGHCLRPKQRTATEEPS